MTLPSPAATDAPRPATVADLAELAVVVRNGFPESRHLGILSALDAGGTPTLELGNATTLVFPRSAVKAFQAIACLRAGADLADETLAIAAASHPGSDHHVAAALAILHAAGLTEDDLRCPAALPRDDDALAAALRAGSGRRRVWYNCSGKHAAMLAACVASGWDTASYLDPGHPLQLLVRGVIEEFAGPVGHVGVDGCGAPVFAITVRGLASAYHRLVTAPPQSDAGRVVGAMRNFPYLVAGHGHDNTVLCQSMPGVIAKAGAEGVLAVATPSGHAVAVKVADGADRAATLVALAALERLGVDVSGAAALRDVPVLGGGARVGGIEPGAAFDR